MRSAIAGLGLMVLGACGGGTPGLAGDGGASDGPDALPQQDGGGDGASSGDGAGADAPSPDAPAPLPPGTWEPAAPLPRGARQETAVAALEGLVYVIGGFDASRAVVADVEVFDPGTGTWATRKPLPRAVHHANAASAAGRLYVVGALVTGSFTAIGDVFEYDPGRDTWTAKTAMPPMTFRGGSGVGVIGDRIFVAGGYRGGSVADFSAYDAASDRWETLPPLPTPRDHLVGGAVGGTFYAIGGRTNGITTHTGRVDAYDLAARTWTPRAPMPTPRGGAAAGVVDGRLVVAGGEGAMPNPPGVFDDVEAYDPVTDTWSTHTPMTTPRHGTGAAGIGRKLYVPGGATVQAFGAVPTVEVLVF